MPACLEHASEKAEAGNQDSLLSEEIKIDSIEERVRNFEPVWIGITEQNIINAGLIDIKSIDTSIVVDMKYSSPNNFLGLDVYGDFNKCYLQPDVALKLKTAQTLLRQKFPYYSLIVYDAARPRSIQEKMWDTIDVPGTERSKYVSNPKNGSLHNFGAAVDLSIIDENGYELDMGTGYDYFGELAYPREEERMMSEGKLSHKQFLNRDLLREVMEQAGFTGITTEWWHFNSCYRNEAYSRYSIIE
ncbi:MAG: M15 family metallopeptidase [Bacteroidota bacterium]|nr:M15 family metallopeptidase [Bacteroidota bacterium]